MRTIGELASVRQGMAMARRTSAPRTGCRSLSMVESADIVDDHLHLDGVRAIEVRHDARAESHLLHPFDILVTARSSAVKAALVPPGVSRTVASITLLVVRTPDPGGGLAHFLWYHLCSTHGRAELAARLTMTSLPTLSAKALREVPVIEPQPGELRRLAEFIDAAEASRAAALEAVHVRHDVLRDAIVSAFTPHGRNDR